jgi:hypothetical protein
MRIDEALRPLRPVDLGERQHAVGQRLDAAGKCRIGDMIEQARLRRAELGDPAPIGARRRRRIGLRRIGQQQRPLRPRSWVRPPRRAPW